MKKSIYLFCILAFVVISCNKEDEISEDVQAQIIEKLQGEWSTQEVRRDNAVIPDFSNFMLTISDKSYTSENGSPVWPESGTFDFENAETENEFIRSDGRLFTAVGDNSNLKITVIYQDNTARGEYGTYEFSMKKN